MSRSLLRIAGLLAVLGLSATAQASLPQPLFGTGCVTCDVHPSGTSYGEHEHYFWTSSTQAMNLGANDSAYVYIYLDPANPPSQIMVQWLNSSGWQRAWWGVGYNTTDLLAVSGYYGGGGFYAAQFNDTTDLGRWQRLTVPKYFITGSGAITGMAFTLYDGHAYWGHAGSIANGTGPEVVWVGNGLPAGSSVNTDGADDWTFVPFFRRSWLQFGGDPAHSGNNVFENIITPENIWALQPQLTYSSGFELGPLILATPYSLDTMISDSSFNHFGAGSTDVDISSHTFVPTPAMAFSSKCSDQNTYQTVAYGVNTNDLCVHKFNAVTGAELDVCGNTITNTSCPSGTTSNFPARVTAVPKLPNAVGDVIQTALTVGTVNQKSYVYVGTDGSAYDGHPYQGSATLINASSATAEKVFNTMCSNQAGHVAFAGGNNGCTNGAIDGGGLWQMAGFTFDILTQRLLVSTANVGSGVVGGADSTQGRWANTLVAFGASDLSIKDSWRKQGETGSSDNDLAYTNTLILPNTLNSTFPHIAVQSSKDSHVRLINLDNMTSHAGGPLAGQSGGELAIATIPTLAGCSESNDCVTGPLATWIDPVGDTWFYVNSKHGVNAFRLTYGSTPGITSGTDLGWGPNFDGTFVPPDPGGRGGVVVANGILYVPGANSLTALRAESGQVLRQIMNLGGNNAATPVVVNGAVYYNGNQLTLNANGSVANSTAWPVNLAEGGANVSVSAAYASPPAGTANLGNDGNYDGNWSHNSVFHTTNGAATVVSGKPGGPWWKVYLGGTRTVNQVILYNRTDCCQGRMSGLWIIGHNSSGYFIASDQSGFNASASTKVMAFNLNNVSTDYIVIQKASSGADNYLHLAEVQVLGTQ